MLDVLTPAETMARLSPAGHLRRDQGMELEMMAGGAEANMAVVLDFRPARGSRYVPRIGRSV